MNAKDYQEACARTAVHKDELSLATHEVNMLHAAMGMCTEAAELLEGFKLPLQIKHIEEEIGDVMWYMSLAYSTLEVEHAFVPVPRERFKGDLTADSQCMLHGRIYAGRLVIIAGEFMDTLKKSFMYGKQVDQDHQLSLLDEMTTELETLVLCARTTVPMAMFKNIVKLKARYPEKFTEKDAIERDVDAELAAMEETDESDWTGTLTLPEHVE